MVKSVSLSVRLKRKRKVETETTSPKKRRHMENEVSKNSFRLNDLNAVIFVWGKAKNVLLIRSFLFYTNKRRDAMFLP